MGESIGVLTLRARHVLGLNQRSLAEMLHISTRTVQRWDSKQSYPFSGHIEQLSAAVYPHDRDLAEQLAVSVGTTVVRLGLEAAPSDAPDAALHTIRGRHVIDSVVCAAAEALDAPPSTVRPVLLAAFRRASELGLLPGEVVALLEPKVTPSKSKSSKTS